MKDKTGYSIFLVLGMSPPVFDKTAIDFPAALFLKEAIFRRVRGNTCVTSIVLLTCGVYPQSFYFLLSLKQLFGEMCGK